MVDKENNGGETMDDLDNGFVVLDKDGKAENDDLQKEVPIIDDGEIDIMESFDSGDEDPIPAEGETNNDENEDDEDDDGSDDEDDDGGDDEDELSEDDEDEVDDEDDEATDEDDDEEDGDGDADDTDDDDDEDDAPDPRPKKKKQTVQDRINQAVKKQREAERRAEAAEKRAQELEERTKNKLTDKDDDDNVEDESNSESGDLEAPNPDDYQYGELDAKYIAELAKYETKKVLAADEQKRKKETEAAAAQKQQEEWKQSYETRVDAGKSAYEDFEKVVLDGADAKKYDLTLETAQMAIASPVGHHVMYLLASNPKLAKKLAQMPVIEQAQEFGRLAARFDKKQSPKPKPNRKPKAPPPPSTRRGGKGFKQFDPETASFEDFEKNALKELYPADQK